jgi:hypothetical protein
MLAHLSIPNSGIGNSLAQSTEHRAQSTQDIYSQLTQSLKRSPYVGRSLIPRTCGYKSHSPSHPQTLPRAQQENKLCGNRYKLTRPRGAEDLPVLGVSLAWPFADPTRPYAPTRRCGSRVRVPSNPPEASPTCACGSAFEPSGAQSLDPCGVQAY